MDLKINTENGFKYVEEGEGPALLFLHGLFGALSNFEHVFEAFSSSFKIVIPVIPLYEKGASIKPTVEGLTNFVESFIEFRQLSHFSLMGNSLGGHIALIYTLRNPEKVDTLILTGSSGLFESGMGAGFPRRSSYRFVQERVAYTFFNPDTATDALVDEVYDIVNDNVKTLNLLKVARSAQRHNMRDDVVKIQAPTLLIWGLNDNITPPRVAHEFDKLIPNTELRFIDKCGHAPMMERPEIFNNILKSFLDKYIKITA